MGENEDLGLPAPSDARSGKHAERKREGGEPAVPDEKKEKETGLFLFFLDFFFPLNFLKLPLFSFLLFTILYYLYYF